MGVIGYNTIGGDNTSQSNTLNQILLDDAAYSYIAPASEEVFRLWFYCGLNLGDASGVEIGVYDISSGAASASLVASGTITGPLTASSWNSVDITPVALTESNTYAVALRLASATNITMYRDYDDGASSGSTLNGTSALAASWTDNSSGEYAFSFYAETQAGSVTVNPILTDTLLDAENSNAAVASETNLTIHVYDTDGGTELYSTTTATTDGSGVFTIDDDSVGSVNDTPFVVVKRSNGQTACGTMTVVDGNA